MRLILTKSLKRQLETLSLSVTTSYLIFVSSTHGKIAVAGGILPI
ncbi:hypothetical protein QE382_002358 [Sphingobacterium zeae]|uniref:Uncharacterized protein n=1 Tax=Sphingobacterium zeae TaxID=1776859 RepID=A0ABU0U5Y7_9SPHI|nr:hypothetical protein [Sphingobacterium zeae]